MTNEHNTQVSPAFSKAAKLIEGRIHLDGRQLAKPRLFERFRLWRALRLLEVAAQAEPSNGAPLLFAAKVEERLGNQRACLEWLRRAYAVAPENHIVALELGAALGRAALHAESIPILAAAVRRDPDDPRVHCNLGLALLFSGDIGRAVSAFEYLVRLEPDVAINQRLLAVATDVGQGRLPRPGSEGELATLMRQT
jgi:protein O-GlcNAc transferase